MKLSALSWTWDDALETLIRPRFKKSVTPVPFEEIWAELLSLQNKLELLRSLLIHIPDVFDGTRLIVQSYASMCFLISLCRNLEQLWLFSWPKTMQERKASLQFVKEEFHPDIQFPHLHTFVCSTIQPLKVYVPRLTAHVLKSFQRKTDVEGGSQDTTRKMKIWVDHPLIDVQDGAVGSKFSRFNS
jgi:hypothetical protein